MAGRLVPDPFLFFKKSFIWDKYKLSADWFQYISIALNLSYNKNKLYRTLGYWSRDMFNFNILEKGLGKVSLSHVVYDFARKMFLMLYFINCLNFIVWLSLLLEILVNMCSAVVCFSGCDVINLAINLIFQIKLFFYMNKNSR